MQIHSKTIINFEEKIMIVKERAQDWQLHVLRAELVVEGAL